jgi:hypothetical protein
MSFGLRNAAQTFQRFMDVILRGIHFCFAKHTTESIRGLNLAAVRHTTVQVTRLLW